MSEGNIAERILEGGEEEGEGERLAAPDPVAVAIAIDGARFDADLSQRAGKYLDGQSRLVAIQTEHLHEQREVQLSHLKLRRWSERMRVSLQLFLMLIGTVIGLGIFTLLYDAFTSRNVVVEAFQTPPALAGRGLNGVVVATQLLDGLQKLEEATRGPSQGLTTRSAWSSDIKVELPETGISIGEIDRLLHARFGHDVRIEGDLIQTPDGGLALTIRGDGIPARTFAGPIDDLDRLTTQAAEYGYSRSQPWLYAIYLSNAGRYQDILDFIPAAYARASPAERPNLANVWGLGLINLGRAAEAVDKYRLEISLSPRGSDNWWKGWSNIISAFVTMGREEQAWQESVKYLRAVEAAPPAEKPALRLLSQPAQIAWDLPLMLKADLAESAINGGAGASSVPLAPDIADAFGLMHDHAKAAQYMALSDPADPSAKLEANLLRAYAALDRDDAAATVAPMVDASRLWAADREVLQHIPDAPCFLGLALGLNGRLAEAETIFRATGSWSRCYALHGTVLAHAGDHAGAMRVWAEGLAIGPDLALIYLKRGLFELSQGQLRAAQSDFATAHAKSPHYADPLKAWGDVLARAGRWQEARIKYDEALIYAPAWEALRRAREVAARKTPA